MILRNPVETLPSEQGLKHHTFTPCSAIERPVETLPSEQGLKQVCRSQVQGIKGSRSKHFHQNKD